MGKKGASGGGENSKKASGSARKAEAAASKAAALKKAEEDTKATQWDEGAKVNSKAEKDAQKAAEKARKKAELAALEAEDERNAAGPSQPKKTKAAAKKTAAAAPSRGTLDLSQLDEDGSDGKGNKANPQSPMDISASGIDNALDALNLTQGSAADDASKIDRHPERRLKAAYAAFEERRLQEMAADGSGTGLRLRQRKDRISKEFEKSPENPLNQIVATYNATQDELLETAQGAREKVEGRLTSSAT